MLRTFDGRVTLDIGKVLMIYSDRLSGKELYTIVFHSGKHQHIETRFSTSTLEEEYPEFTEWFLSLGKEECATT